MFLKAAPPSTNPAVRSVLQGWLLLQLRAVASAAQGGAGAGTGNTCSASARLAWGQDHSWGDAQQKWYGEKKKKPCFLLFSLKSRLGAKGCQPASLL